jgi:hypothetical protein
MVYRPVEFRVTDAMFVAPPIAPLLPAKVTHAAMPVLLMVTAPPAVVLLARDFQPEPVQICRVSDVAFQRIAPLMLEAQVRLLPATWMASEAEMVPTTSSLAMGEVLEIPTRPPCVMLHSGCRRRTRAERGAACFYAGDAEWAGPCAADRKNGQA